jgi:asparagine synthase (glutamine-hydrolysing)
LTHRVAAMVSTLVHRGPDDQGLTAARGAAIGMCRLSIIDIHGGNQPIFTEDASIAVVQNGEIYNFAALRTELEASGHRFRTRSDTEVIAHAYEEHGAVTGMASLHGMFAIAIWDSRTHTLVLARDRLGKKPLYFAHDGRRVVFGSEIKALLAADPALGTVDDEALVPYLRYGFVPEPRTMYRHIQVVPPGHVLTFQDGRLTVTQYWHPIPPDGDAAPKTFESCLEELDALFVDAVQERLVSEAPLGLFLSGGLDSSIVTAYAARASRAPVRTFTIGFDHPRWDESKDAARVAAHFGTDHHELTLHERDVERTLPETLFALAGAFDQPFGDPSALPMYHVSQLAAEHVTVILGGDGADELFGGYSTYRGVAFADWFRRLPLAALAPALARLTAVTLRWKRYELLRAAKVLDDSLLPFEDLYLRKKTILRAPQLERLLSAELRPQVLGTEPPAWIPPDVATILRGSASRVQRMGYGDLRFGLLNDMLVKVDRMSMAHSLEVRSPFLDHRIVEFALRLPAAWKVRRQTTKYALRETVRGVLPAATLSKPKQGFNVPLREWLCGSLASLTDDLLLGSDLLPRELFDHTGVEALLAAHRERRADHSDAIWLLLSYAAWRSTRTASPSPDHLRSRRLVRAGSSRGTTPTDD